MIACDRGDVVLVGFVLAYSRARQISEPEQESLRYQYRRCRAGLTRCIRDPGRTFQALPGGMGRYFRGPRSCCP